MLFLVLPGLVLVVVSLVTRGAYGQLEWTFTLENYKRLAGFTTFGWTPDYRKPGERIDWWYHNLGSVTGAGVASGTYFARLGGPAAPAGTRKITLVR